MRKYHDPMDYRAPKIDTEHKPSNDDEIQGPEQIVHTPDDQSRLNLSRMIKLKMNKACKMTVKKT